MKSVYVLGVECHCYLTRIGGATPLILLIMLEGIVITRRWSSVSGSINSIFEGKIWGRELSAKGNKAGIIRMEREKL